MKNKFQWSINDYWHYIALFTYFLLLLYQHNFICLYGDDFYYGTFLKQDFLRKHIEHYLYINGRALVHFIVTLVIYFKTRLFMLLNPLMILGIIILIGKLADEKENSKMSLFLGIVLFSMINISITRQSVFWLDGSFNYVFPMLLVFMSLYLYRKSIQSGFIVFYLPIIGFFAGATTEQASLINFGGLLLLLLSSKFFHNKTPKLTHYITLLLSFLSALTIFLSPGNFERLKIEGTHTNILDTVQMIIKIFFFSKSMQVFNLLLAVGMIAFIVYRRKNIFLNNILICLNITFIFLQFILNSNMVDINYIIHSIALLGLISIALLGFVMSLFYFGIHYFIVEKNELIIISLILAFGAQFMMLFSPVYGYRVLLSAILLYFIPLIIFLRDYWKEQYVYSSMVLVLCICSSNRYFIILGLCLLIIDIVSNNLGHLAHIIRFKTHALFFLILLITLNSNWNNIKGYKINYDVNEFNELQIQKHIENESKNTILYLKEMPLYDYGWSYPYVNSYHLKVMKDYYNIAPEIKIEFVPN